MFKENGYIQRVFDLNASKGDVVSFVKNFPFVLKRVGELNLLKRRLSETCYDMEDLLIVSSETRSGSTWVHDVLLANYDIITNWEPFNPSTGVLDSSLNLGNRPFFQKETFSGIYQEEINRCLTFKKVNFWNTSYVRPKEFTKQLLFNKLVGGNLLLPNLTAEYKFKRKPILLLRHPIPTSMSQLRYKKVEMENSRLFEDPKNYGNNRFEGQTHYLNSLSSTLERKVAIWCINNIATINNSSSSEEWEVIYYEDILDNPEAYFKKIFRIFGLKVPNKINGIHSASTSLRKGDQFNFTKQKQKWLTQVSEPQKVAIQKVFDHFDLKSYNAFSANPVKNSL